MTGWTPDPRPPPDRTSPTLPYLAPGAEAPRGPVSATNVVMGAVVGSLCALPFAFLVGVGKALSVPPQGPWGQWICLVIGTGVVLVPLLLVARHLDRRRHPGVLVGVGAVVALSLVAAVFYVLMPY